MGLVLPKSSPHRDLHAGYISSIRFPLKSLPGHLETKRHRPHHIPVHVWEGNWLHSLCHWQPHLIFVWLRFLKSIFLLSLPLLTSFLPSLASFSSLEDLVLLHLQHKGNRSLGSGTLRRVNEWKDSALDTCALVDSSTSTLLIYSTLPFVGLLTSACSALETTRNEMYIYWEV